MNPKKKLLDELFFEREEGWIRFCLPDVMTQPLLAEKRTISFSSSKWKIKSSPTTQKSIFFLVLLIRLFLSTSPVIEIPLDTRIIRVTKKKYTVILNARKHEVRISNVHVQKKIRNCTKYMRRIIYTIFCTICRMTLKYFNNNDILKLTTNRILFYKRVFRSVVSSLFFIDNYIQYKYICK